MTPGQAQLRKTANSLTLTVCDERRNIPMGAVEFGGYGELHLIETVNGITVAVAELVLILNPRGVKRQYRAFVNELEEGVMESLAAAPQITVLLSDPKGETFGASTVPNPFKATANETLGIVSGLAKKWNGAQFAVAAKYVLALEAD